jgi:hypothetical protein
VWQPCLWKDGESQRFEWCSKEHVQCWEARKAAGHDQAFFKGYRQVSVGHAEAWLASISFLFFDFSVASFNFWTSPPCAPLFWTPGYIGEFEFVDDHRSGKIVVELNGRLNKCGVISPRFDVGVKEIEPWTARLLPSRQVSMQISILHTLWKMVCFMMKLLLS